MEKDRINSFWLNTVVVVAPSSSLLAGILAEANVPSSIPFPPMVIDGPFAG